MPRTGTNKLLHAFNKPAVIKDTDINPEIAADLPVDEPAPDRIAIRLSKENYRYLKAEAERTGNTMSSLASLAVADWITSRKQQFNEAMMDEEVLKKAVEKALREMTDAIAKANKK